MDPNMKGFTKLMRIFMSMTKLSRTWYKKTCFYLV